MILNPKWGVGEWGSGGVGKGKREKGKGEELLLMPNAQCPMPNAQCPTLLVPDFSALA